MAASVLISGSPRTQITGDEVETLQRDRLLLRHALYSTMHRETRGKADEMLGRADHSALSAAAAGEGPVWLWPCDKVELGGRD